MVPEIIKDGIAKTTDIRGVLPDPHDRMSSKPQCRLGNRLSLLYTIHRGHTSFLWYTHIGQK